MAPGRYGGRAVHVGRIAIGEIEDTKDEPSEKKAADEERPVPAEAAE